MQPQSPSSMHYGDACTPPVQHIDGINGHGLFTLQLQRCRLVLWTLVCCGGMIVLMTVMLITNGLPLQQLEADAHVNLWIVRYSTAFGIGAALVNRLLHLFVVDLIPTVWVFFFPRAALGPSAERPDVHGNETSRRKRHQMQLFLAQTACIALMTTALTSHYVETTVDQVVSGLDADDLHPQMEGNATTAIATHSIFDELLLHMNEEDQSRGNCEAEDDLPLMYEIQVRYGLRKATWMQELTTSAMMSHSNITDARVILELQRRGSQVLTAMQRLRWTMDQAFTPWVSYVNDTLVWNPDVFALDNMTSYAETITLSDDITIDLLTFQLPLLQNKTAFNTTLAASISCTAFHCALPIHDAVLPTQVTLFPWSKHANRSTTAFSLGFSSHATARGLNKTEDNGTTRLVDPVKYYTISFTRLSWTPEDLGTRFNATCRDAQSQCHGISLPLPHNRFLLLGSQSFPSVRRMQSLVRLQLPLDPVEISNDDMALGHDGSLCLSDAQVFLQRYHDRHYNMQNHSSAIPMAALLFLFEHARLVEPQTQPNGKSMLAFHGNHRHVALRLQIPHVSTALSLVCSVGLVAAMLVLVVTGKRRERLLQEWMNAHTIAEAMLNEYLYSRRFLQAFITIAPNQNDKTPSSTATLQLSADVFHVESLVVKQNNAPLAASVRFERAVSLDSIYDVN